MTSGTQTGGFHSILVEFRVFFLPLGCSLRLPGILDDGVDSARDNFLRG
jgi:hypothetical protein